MLITDLPPEVLLKIFSYLHQRDLVHGVSLICEVWNELSLWPRLWKHLTFNLAYDDPGQSYTHFAKINNFIHSLVIHPSLLYQLLGNYRFAFSGIQLSNLEHLHLTDQVSGYLVDTIVQNLTSIKHFKAYFDSKFDMQRCLNSLEELKIISIDFGWYGLQNIDNNLIKFLTKQSCLKKLVLRGWQTLRSETVALILNDYHDIEQLYLSNSQISNVIVNSNLPIPGLSDFTIRSTIFDDIGISQLVKRSNNLRFIDIRECSNITFKGLTEVAKHCPLLESLKFGNSTFIINDRLNFSIQSLAEGCPKLKSITFVGIKLILDDELVCLIKATKYLECLTLSESETTSDIPLYALGKYCSNLKQITFRNCHKISADGIMYIVKHSRRLQTLKIKSCGGIGDYSNNSKIGTNDKTTGVVVDDGNTGFRQETKLQNDSERNDLLRYSDSSYQHSHLLSLDMTQCANILPRTILAIAKMCPDIRELYLTCDFLKSNEVEELTREIFDTCMFLGSININERVIELSSIQTQD
ncbi:F-box/LRR-repeat protein 2-like isoform X1 [Mytilus californianus]|uniref:F-box/LRR-repeat protein 2-like isoform X1 n=1 Tax=Mytilus californianus TaxID=6549 RepID=UPI0022470C9B|nr:F-box/LRR-repeat protein 2-like isoform X1 [Mytilus californianus]